jgi:PKD repeat protein
MKSILILLLFGINFSLFAQTVSLSASKNNQCVPMQVSFTATAPSNAFHYNWSYYDYNQQNWVNDYSNTNVYSFTYSQPGTNTYFYVDVYDVDWGYLGSSYVNILTKGNTPFLSASQQTVCPNSVINFYINNQAGNYQWDFGDGTILNNNDQYINHNYSSTGNYLAKVTYTNVCGVLETATTNITVANNINSPVQINTSNLSPCPGESVNFYSGFTATNYFWDFGDGSTASGNQSTNYTYNQPGNYDVKLITLNGCGLYDSTIVNVSVNNNSSFSPFLQIFSKDQLCPGERFYMSTDYGFKSYTFDFGDGYIYTSGSGFSNTYTYNNPGIYTVSIKMTNFCGNDTTIYKNVEINNSISPALQGFGISGIPPVCPGSTIELSAYGEIQQAIWNMGNGNIDTLNSNEFNYTYNTPGIKNASVTLTNFCNLDTTINFSINVDPNTPISSFNTSVYPSNSCPGDRIGFYVSASGDNDFFIVLSNNPTDTIFKSNFSTSNIFTPGNYTAYFGIKNFCGKDTVVQKTFTISNNIPVSQSISLYTPDMVCVNSNLEFCPPYGYKNYSWDFGNGSVFSSVDSKCSNQVYNTAGNYTVTLNLENNCGLDTTLYKSVTIVNSKTLEQLSLDIDPTSCPGDIWEGRVNLSENDRNSTTFSWSFGDGNSINTSNSYAEHSYLNVGNYPLSVKINNSCGPDTTLTALVKVGLNDQINPNSIWLGVSQEVSCPNTLISFSASRGFKKYFWRFSNGDTLTTQTSEINKSFPIPGKFRAFVTFYNGCNKTATRSTDFIVSNNAKMDQIEIEPISGSVCPGDNVFIRGDKEGGDATAGITYSWDYGDNQIGYTYTSTSYHTYSNTGTFQIKVTAYNSCGDSTSAVSQVTVSSNSQPEFISFDGDSPILIPNYNGTSAGCPGDAITMLYIGEFSSNVFDFGDGTSGSSNSFLTVGGFKFHTITHIYDNPGDYMVSLTVSNACGNSNSDSLLVKIGNTTSENSVDIFAIPSKKPEGYTTCTPVEYILFGAKTYTIDFGDGTVSTTSSPSLRHSYSNPGFYHVTITGTNGCGYTSSSSTDVIVIEGGSLTANVSTLTPSCFNGSNGSISVNIQDGFPPYNFEWMNYNTNNSNTLSGIGAGTYNVSVIDSVGCIKDLSIVLFDAPQIEIITSNMVKPNCQTSDGLLTVNASNGNGNYSYQWVNGPAGNTISGIPSGLYTVTATDGTGCQTSSTISLLDRNGPSISVDSSFSLLKVCKGGSDANIELTVSGGTQPYTYTWSNGSNAPNQSNLAEGNYIIQVADASGCRSNKNIRIEAYPSIFTNINVNRNPDCKQFNGELTFNVTGGSGAFELSLDGNLLAGNTATGVNAGKHTLVLTDLNSFCTSDTVFYLNNAGTLDFSVTKKNPKCYGTSDGLISIVPSGGTPSYFSMVTSSVYNSPKSTKTLFNNLSEATFRIQVEDKVGCIVNKLITLDAPDSLSTNFTRLSAYCGNNNGSISGLVSGGTQPFTVALTGQNSQNGSSYNFNNLPGGNYTLTIRDSNFCQKSKSISIQTQPASILANISTTASVCGKAQGSAITNASGGYAPYTYSWSTGTSGNSINNLVPGVYSLTITDNRQCSVTENFGIDTLIVMPGICLITVDSASEKNLLMWEKTPGSNIQSYNVYREGVVQNQFNLIANVPVNQLSEYLDPNSNTRVQSYRYKISAIDSCGNESDLSDFHKTIHLLISQGTGNNWNLEWYNYQGLPIPSYSIWRSLDSINYTLIDTKAATIDPQSNTYTDITAPAGDVYYIVSFEAPNECNSDLNRISHSNSIFRTQKRVKSNVGSNRLGNPSLVKGKAADNIEIYPNPNNGFFTIDVTNEIANAQVKITNQLGQIVLNINPDEIKENRINVNFTKFDSGVYFIHIVSDNATLTKRIIKY